MTRKARRRPLPGFRIRNTEAIGMTEVERVAAGIMADRPLYVITMSDGTKRPVYLSDLRRDVCQNTLMPRLRGKR